MQKSSTILQRIARGDRAAVDDCIKTYSGLIWSIGKRYLSDPCELEDVTQEIFIELWKNASRFDPACSQEGTFIAMIARRRVIDRFRRQRSVPSVESLEENHFEPPEDATIDSLTWGEDLIRVLRCMRGLDKARREVLILNLRDGVPMGRIAERLALPLGTVKSHARRGLIQVRRCMGLEPLDVRSQSAEVVR